MQALVKIGSSQFLVTPGMELNVALMEKTTGDLILDQILLTIDEKTVQVGQPVVPGAKVHASIMGSVKGTKIRVSKFKAKSRYDKTVGFRPKYTRLKIDKITTVKHKLDNREK